MIQKVAVVGAGTMGHGIAQVAAQAGYSVSLYDLAEEVLERALANIGRNLEKAVEKGKMRSEDRDAVLCRISSTLDLAAAVADADLVIEAVPESLELKLEVFAKLDSLCKPQALLATNTSSLSVARIAAATARPELVLGMHFFNPVHIMKLLEIVHTEATSSEAIDTAKDIARRMGKEPIVVRNYPGFASSRLGVALGLEAIRMLEQGVASAQDIDKAMELGYNHPMGPLRLTDLVGLDVRLSIADYLYQTLGSEVFRAPRLLRQMVAEGKLGRKSGEGFYKWTE
ncbi:MAG: 3-hydroxyacyl-CoA dehydrogenase family protein [Acidobacteriota bacterium]|nr:3-hydroxyacyl-CoA dehydrogenase family protein [Blastocatellia bacterium]MDW8412869.1 3-hydroxyacyl-CoA dehydrogenase family protein [Acidobacteriota bacterium]